MLSREKHRMQRSTQRDRNGLEGVLDPCLKSPGIPAAVSRPKASRQLHTGHIGSWVAAMNPRYEKSEMGNRGAKILT